MRVLSSLQTKLTVGCLALVLGVAGLAFAITVRAARQALMDATQTELVALAAVIAEQLSGPDGDTLALLVEGREGSPEYLRLRERLRRIRGAHADIRYVYIMRPTAVGAAFIVDADYGNDQDPGAAIGEPYEASGGRLLEGFVHAVADDDFTTDRWGTLLSGYAPVRDSRGSVVALVGVDMASDRVLANQQFVGYTVLVVIAAGVALVGVLVLLFSQTIIKDLRQLIRAATAMSMGSMDTTIDVHRSDEIGDLAAAFSRMVASLKIMMQSSHEL
jgi:HAMP domain-containing protein